MKKNKNIQVYRQIDTQDKTVFEAIEITSNFKVLPYREVNKILESKSVDFSDSLRAKAKI